MLKNCKLWLSIGANLSLLACASPGGTADTEGGGGEAPVSASGGSSSTTGGGTSSGGNLGSGGSSAAGGVGTSTGGSQVPLDPDLFLPFAIDDEYVPSGFMGDLEHATMDPEGCLERVPDAQGNCYQITYAPEMLDASFGTNWAGVFWQSPENNWGEQPGHVVEPGATKIVFSAWAETDGLSVKFLAGGIGGIDTDYQDTFKVEQAKVLGTSPAEFELDLSSSNYSMVLGGFGWVVEANSLDPIVFYVDDVRWKK